MMVLRFTGGYLSCEYFVSKNFKDDSSINAFINFLHGRFTAWGCLSMIVVADVNKVR